VARDLLACSSSEVDVERLFSECRDEYGIRRHVLKAETVSVTARTKLKLRDTTKYIEEY
jgi:hypothetical protein